MAEKQVKSRQRVADHGEVFTAEREVRAMCDLVKSETERIDSRFLEPACGDGNFPAEARHSKAELRPAPRQLSRLRAVCRAVGHEPLRGGASARQRSRLPGTALSHI